MRMLRLLVGIALLNAVLTSLAWAAGHGGGKGHTSFHGAQQALHGHRGGRHFEGGVVFPRGLFLWPEGGVFRAQAHPSAPPIGLPLPPGLPPGMLGNVHTSAHGMTRIIRTPLTPWTPAKEAVAQAPAVTEPIASLPGEPSAHPEPAAGVGLPSMPPEPAAAEMPGRPGPGKPPPGRPAPGRPAIGD